MNVEFKTSIGISAIDDQLVTALEGGSNYWYFIPVTDIKAPENFKRNESIHYEMLDKVYQGATLEVYDAEDQEEKLGELSMESIKKGLELMAKDHSVHYSNMIQEDGDATTADVFFQLCVLGEITFG